MQIETEYGPAEVMLEGPARAGFLLVLTHGAGGGVETADLLAARDAGLAAGGAVARVLQPYRVRGGRVPGSVPRQDESWLEIIAALRGRSRGWYKKVPLVQGGRSNGARVACRTASAAGASAVLALAFPLHPPGRPDKSRADELRAAGVNVLVINGDRDPFGIPDRADAAKVVVLPGQTHGLSGAKRQIEREVSAWLGAVLADGGAVSTSAAR